LSFRTSRDGAKNVKLTHYRTLGSALSNILTHFADAGTAITVNARAFPGYPELVQALQAALAAKTPPAVVQIGYTYLRYVAGQLPHITIDEMAKRDTQAGEFLSAKNFAPVTLDLGRVDGVLHGMPYAISVPVLFTNVDLLRQAGVERPPQTWAEVREHARAIKGRTGKLGIYIDQINNFWMYQALIEGNGGRLLVGSGADLRCGMDSPEAAEAVQFVADLVLREKTMPNLPQQQGQMVFKSGEVAMDTTSIGVLADLRQGTKFELGTALFPTFGPKLRRVPVGGNALFITATDNEQQAAGWEWIKFLLSPEALTTWVQGTGYLSPRLGLAEDPKYLKPYFDTNQLVRPAVGELSDVAPWVSWPGANGLQASQELYDAVQMTLAGAEVTSTLRTVAQRVNQLIRS